jgi:hypothetical protein
MLVSSFCRSTSNWLASSAEMVMEGPLASTASGWSRRTTTAVAILASEAMGTGPSSADWSAYPSDGISTAA